MRRRNAQLPLHAWSPNRRSPLAGPMAERPTATRASSIPRPLASLAVRRGWRANPAIVRPAARGLTNLLTPPSSSTASVSITSSPDRAAERRPGSRPEARCSGVDVAAMVVTPRCLWSRTSRPRTRSFAGWRSIRSGVCVMPSSRWSTVVSAAMLVLVAVTLECRHEFQRHALAGAVELAVRRAAGRPSRTAPSDAKRTRGCSSTAKKSDERRCLSRLVLPVSRLAASIVSSIAGSWEKSSLPS